MYAIRSYYEWSLRLDIFNHVVAYLIILMLAIIIWMMSRNHLSYFTAKALTEGIQTTFSDCFPGFELDDSYNFV